jgi:hypothetical protein
MIRKQVYIEERQDRLLKQRARQLGVTEAELIRDSIDRNLVTGASWRPNPAAWEALKRSFERRLRMKVPQVPRSWTRDELYDRPRAYR